MIRISLAGISIAAANRPAGYEAACLSAGEIDGDDLLLSEEAFASIRNSFPSFDYAKPPKPSVMPEALLQSLQTPKPPSLLKMVGNLVKATVAESKAVILKEPPVSEAEYQRRLKLCGTCDLFEKSAGRCMSCGCFMTYKAKMRSQQCPTGKWGPVR